MYYEKIKKIEEDNDIEKQVLICDNQLNFIHFRDKLKTAIKKVLKRNNPNILMEIINTFINHFKSDDCNVIYFLTCFSNNFNTCFFGNFDVSHEFFDLNDINNITDIKFLNKMTENLNKD